MSDHDLPAPLAYGAWRYREGQDGHTLLVGLAAAKPLFAVSAGLGGQQDRERFVVLARYLLRRDGADGYWLLMPAESADEEQLVVEAASLTQRQCLAAAVLRDETGAFRGLGSVSALDMAPPLGDLRDGSERLAGLMRRELDRLAEAIARPLP